MKTELQTEEAATEETSSLGIQERMSYVLGKLSARLGVNPPENDFMAQEGYSRELEKMRHEQAAEEDD